MIETILVVDSRRHLVRDVATMKWIQYATPRLHQSERDKMLVWPIMGFVCPNCRQADNSDTRKIWLNPNNTYGCTECNGKPVNPNPVTL